LRHWSSGQLKFTQRSINFPLIEVSKREKDWLIKNNYIELKNGKYVDLTVTSRKKSKGKRKKYYVIDNMAEILKQM